MNLTWTTSLRVFPRHCNHHDGMIFGGEMMAEMDLVAAAAVSRFLYDSPNHVKDALTVGFDKGQFFQGAKSGDLIIFNAEIVSVGKKRITVNVTAERETPTRIDTSFDPIGGSFRDCVTPPKREKMATAIFHFCAYDMKLGKGVEHGMEMPRMDVPF